MIRFICMGLSLLAMVNCALGQTPATTTASPSRLAVISSADTADLAALVTTELSNNPDIILVDRDALSKVGDELKIQTMAGSDASALGKLLNADGLLILEKQGDTIHARLTAVGLGYSVFDLQIAPGLDANELSKSLSHRAVQFAPKLKLTSTQAIPISILNLRSDLSTQNSTKVERDLTLLLESRLASIPEYVVLERRHAWDLGFEHSLITPSGPQVLEGAYVVDGTLRLTDANGGEITVQLRLRTPKSNQETPLEVKGKPDDLPALVEAMVAQINKAIGSPTSTSTWQPQTEAREYLREGIWAWEHGQPQASVEALDSAELLGEKAPDLLAVRIQALCQLAVPDFNPAAVEFISAQYNPDIISFGGANPTHHYTPLLPLPDRLAFVKRAISDLSIFLAPAGPTSSPLQLLDSKWQHEVQLSPSKHFVIHAASSVLAELDRKNDPEAEALREQVRQVAGFDPGKGEVPEDGEDAAFFMDDWAHSLDEEMAYYQSVLSAPGSVSQFQAIFLKARFLWGKGTTFCPRFITDALEQRKAYLEFTQNLMKTPEGRLSALLILSGDEDISTQETSYSDFLDELGRQAPEIVPTNELFAHCHAAFLLPDALHQKFGDHAIPALRCFLTQSNHLDARVLNILWFPARFPSGDAAAIWSEFNSYKARVINPEKKNENQAQFYFGVAEADFIKAFPTFAAASNNSLSVTRFWQPDIGKKNGAFFSIRDCQVLDNSLAIEGGGAYLQSQKVYVVNPPDFNANPFNMPKDIFPFGFDFSANAYYVTAFNWTLAEANTVKEHHWHWHLFRYDRSRQTWETQDAPLDFCEPYLIRDQLYLTISSGNGQHGAITKYDWDTQKLTLLSSDRRRPAQNQFDDRAGYQVLSLFPGINGTIGTNIDFACYTVSETPGNWSDLIPDFTIKRAVRMGDKTLLENYSEHICLLLDPTKDKPEILFAPPNSSLPPALAAYGPPHWQVDPETIVKAIPGSMGMHGDAFFSLTRFQTTPAHYELNWLDSAHATEPVHIPLQFSLDSDTKAQLKLLTGSPANFDDIVNPAPLNNLLQMVSTSTGISLYSGSGLWFIPYEDIDAYLKSAQK